MYFVCSENHNFHAWLTPGRVMLTGDSLVILAGHMSCSAVGCLCECYLVNDVKVGVNSVAVRQVNPQFIIYRRLDLHCI